MPLRRRDFDVPAVLARHVQDAGAAAREPAVPRPAATVMLVRDAPGTAGGVEVFTLHRASSMAFAPDTTVFPGGGVDGRDGDDRLPWAGTTPAQWADTLGTDELAARELVVAAVREVFEECGVLLAGTADDVVADLTDPRWAQARERLVAHEISFAELLIDAGLVLRSDLVRAHARWVTPDFEPRRYDTWFFAALVPAGHEADGRTTEAVSCAWDDPADLLARAGAGEVAVLPPTLVQLERLAAAPDAATFVATPPELVCVAPRLRRDGDKVVLTAEVPQ